MAKKSKLLSALDAARGRDHEQERQKKLQKLARRRKRVNAGDEEEGKAEENGAEEVIMEDAKEARAQQEQTVRDVDGEGDPEDHGVDEDQEDDEEDEDEDEDGEDIPLSDLSGDDAADVIPHQKMTINNSSAIRSALKRISFLTDKTPFSEHHSLVSQQEMNVTDPDDDLNRELAFYTVSVAAAKEARRLVKKEGIPFSRPPDYFAEMVKSDEHMGLVKKRLYDEAAAKKASAEAKKQRDLKKFGKQVQIAKLQQRQKEKRETLEKINSLKRKRKSGETGPTADDEDLFDVALDDAGKSEARGTKRKAGGGQVTKRQKKDQKFGFGGKKRFSKSGDAVSSGDLRDFSAAKMKGKRSGGTKQRPGKSRRAAKKF